MLDALNQYQRQNYLLEPDSMVGRNQGWLKSMLDEWHASRPGAGARTDLTRDA